MGSPVSRNMPTEAGYRNRVGGPCPTSDAVRDELLSGRVELDHPLEAVALPVRHVDEIDVGGLECPKLKHERSPAFAADSQIDLSLCANDAAPLLGPDRVSTAASHANRPRDAVRGDEERSVALQPLSLAAERSQPRPG
jgi:hypothetical protein